MFKINFRIVDNFEELKIIKPALFDNEGRFITGFFELCFGEQKEGCYYHENPLREGETGGEILDLWLNYLLDVVNCLSTIKRYAAFCEPETVNRWLEFKRIDEKVIINVAINNKRDNKRFISDFFNGFTYVEPLDFCMEFYELKSKVIDSANRFLDQVKELNPKLLKTKMALRILKKLKALQV